MPFALSLLDFATAGKEQTVRESMDGTVALARVAEEAGYTRVWYAEHHNMPENTSAATSVLLAHVAAHTRSIRLGAGGVMLPNHSPLVIAEQFGTLATLHPDRIDLGVGRAPGTDQNTMYALRRDPRSAERFPADVAELNGYLRGESLVEGVNAYPGHGTKVPLYILGSSLFGAQLAAKLGLPYAFASHFAPAALEQAVATYRTDFTPSEQLAEPYVIAAVGAVAAETSTEAAEQLLAAQRRRVAWLLSNGRNYTDDEADAVLKSAQGRRLVDMMRYTAVGTGAEVADYLTEFAKHAAADELMLTLHAGTVLERVKAAEMIAGAVDNR